MADQTDDIAITRARRITAAGVGDELKRELTAHELLNHGARIGQSPAGNGSVAMPPRAPVDVRSLLEALSRRIRDARNLVETGAPLPARFQNWGTGWLTRLAIRTFRTLGRGFFRDQRYATHAALLALESTGDAMNALLARQEAMELLLWRKVEDANRAREICDAEIMAYLAATNAALRAAQERLETLRRDFDADAAALESLRELLHLRIETPEDVVLELSRLQLRQDEIKRTHGESLAREAARLDALRDQVRSSEMARERGDEELLSYLKSIGAEGTRVADGLADTSRFVGALKADLLAVRTTVDLFGDAITARHGADSPTATPASTTETLGQRRFARLYSRFEDQFRGSEVLVGQRLEVYMGSLRAAFPRNNRGRWLDLGCGRGEWLELLARERFEAIGVDLDQRMLERAREKSLTVVGADVIQYLHDAPPHSFDGVSAFHLIEHLPFGSELALLDEAWRVVRPGGMLILETPNPENLQVGAHTFFLDPTHIRPLPPALLSFMVREIGWKDVEILRLNDDRTGRPAASAPDSPSSPQAARVDQLLFGPRDYGIVARKPV